MDYSSYRYPGASVSLAVFGHGRREAHAIVTAEGGAPFGEQLSAVCGAIDSLTDATRGMTPVWKRWFLSDIANQYALLPADEPCAVSHIQQPPLNGAKLAVWVVLQAGAGYRPLGDGVYADSRGRIIVGDGPATTASPHDITVDSLARVADMLESFGSSLRDGCVRTWFMVRDIDVNYDGVVTGRNEEFARRGLTRHTRFIASTGIGGTPAAKDQSVAFNAICDTRLTPDRIGYLDGPTHFNPTADYGVAFERGTTVDYADRRHVYISGTASINNRGEVMHPGDIRMQTRRMLENVGVLLAEAGCGFGDMASALVYLRDIADAAVVDSIFEEIAPGVPRVILLAPVCRPGWLVETECVAIRIASHPEYAEF